MNSISNAAHSIMIIDDEHDTRVALRQILEAEGYYVFSATNGRDALEILKWVKPPGLILLDLMMPLMSGWDFIKEKRKTPNLADIPTVIITAGAGVAEATLPAEGLIRKPIELSELIKTARKYCKFGGELPVTEPDHKSDTRRVQKSNL